MTSFGNALLKWLALAFICSYQITSGVCQNLVLQSIVREDEVTCGTNGLVPLACVATRYPDLCLSSLCGDVRSGTANLTQLMSISIDLAWVGEQHSIALIQQLVTSVVLDINATSATAVCEETLGYGGTYLVKARDSFLISPVQDIQTWLSAALQFEYDCFSALSNVVNPPANVTGEILPQLNSTMSLISNSLSMTNAFAVYGPDPSVWKPSPEARPYNLSSASMETSQWIIEENYVTAVQALLSSLTPNVTVSLEGTGNYSSIQEAVDNAPAYGSERYVVYIKEGVYNESVRIHLNKTQITFVGDGADLTIITGNKNAAYPGTSTFQTATVVVIGEGFVASGITFQNTAGPYMFQAVAVRVDSDKSIFHDCLFDGYQDTLYTHTGRQFFLNCTILGTVDFIFGDAAAVFLDCLLQVRLGRAGVSDSFVTASGRIDPGQNTGLVFRNCTINGTPDYTAAFQNLASPTALQAYLGRPWKAFSLTVYVSSYLGPSINPAGWYPWDGDFALNSLMFGEFGSFGPGATNLTTRVSWSTQLTDYQAGHFSIDNFIQGSLWLPR